MSAGRVVAVVPAAGRGSRLGSCAPKILLPLSPDVTVWDAIWARLSPHVDRVHVVLSPAGQEPFRERLAAGRRGGAAVTLGVQDPPLGMGDAVFGARSAFEGHDTLLVVWGDQAGLSGRTVRRTLAEHARGAGRRITLPLIEVAEPYVEYVFDPRSGALARVLQRREGEGCSARGLADVGLFCLSTEGLGELWDCHVARAARGGATQELNFLPFLSYLSQSCGYAVTRVVVSDPAETRGINTPADLAYFQSLAARRRRASPRGSGA